MDISTNTVSSLLSTAQSATNDIGFIRSRIDAQLSGRGFMRETAGDCYGVILEGLAEAEHDGLSVFLMGNPGVGKTMLSKCAFPFAQVVQCSQVGNEFDGIPQGQKVVIIDDLGTEPTVFGREPILQAFLGWYDLPPQSRPRLVITTNLSREEIRHRYGDRFISRRRACMVDIEITGDDRRKRENEQPKETAFDGDIDVVRTVEEFNKFLRESRWYYVNLGCWVVDVAHKLPQDKAKAACLIMAESWERARRCDKNAVENAKAILAEEPWKIEKHEKGMAMISVLRKNRRPDEGCGGRMIVSFR